MQLLARSGDLGPTWFHMAIRSLVILAESKEILNSTQLSDMLGADSTYVRKISSKLIENNYIKAKGGRNGGYTLAKDPCDITLLDIYLAFGKDNATPLSSVRSTGTERYISLIINKAEMSFQSDLKKCTIQDLLDFKF